MPKVEKNKSQESVPGAFPETPAAETPGSEPQTFSVNPIPATAGLGNPIKLAPGEPVPDASTLTDNTVASTVKHDKEVEEPSNFGVAPIPATAGLGNPIHLAPGEKVPDASTLTSNTVGSTVTTDASSYEKSDALPPLEFTPQAERDAKGGMFDLPPVAGVMIPESSLPMGVDAKTEKDTGVTIQSAAPTSTTAALAGEVPKEPRGVPETVTESQKEAGVAPEASANPEAVVEKKEVEQELKETVPEAPAATDNSYLSNITKGAAAAAAGITAGAGLFTANALATKDKAADAVGLNGSATADVPAVVAESQKEAHASPEAAANSEAVAEKKAVESELLAEIPKTNEVGESAPVLTAATTETAPLATSEPVAPEVPEVVAESQKEAHVSPEAAANPEAVSEKKEVEAELLKEVKSTDATGEPAPTSATAAGLSDDALVDSKPLKSSSEPDALNAPAAAPAKAPTSKPIDSNTNVTFDKSEPSTTEQTEPVVTTGAETTPVEATTTAPETPKKDARKDSDVSPKGTPGSQSLASGTEDKKKKRRSIFGKLKDKFSSKH